MVARRIARQPDPRDPMSTLITFGEDDFGLAADDGVADHALLSRCRIDGGMSAPEHAIGICGGGRALTKLLTTTRLVLRPCRPDDRADFVGLERDPEVMRFLNGGDAVDRERIDPNASFLMPTGTEPHVWTARRTADDAFVGWFCLWPDADTEAELGYRLRRADWGQGLAAEGTAALVAWGFTRGGYDRITACTMVIHDQSRRVMEKIGMTPHRLVAIDSTPYPGTEQGEVWYAMKRSDWLRAHPTR